ncbi:hypothetical protein [Haloglomus salinum]|jgi:hypothetical protein|uniref:hypothetical protein n=1 Tax=Haloglomus salinum TaxID=2962673 RepID=UPI0020C9E65C|nr:hypothetical protein [Haloglomus salinum]
MFPVAPLQLVDSFLLQYNVGQAILALFILTTLGALPLKSRKIIGLNTVVFGVLFLLTPTPSMQPVHFQFLGIALIFVGPFLVITGRQ